MIYELIEYCAVCEKPLEDCYCDCNTCDEPLHACRCEKKES